MDRATFKTLLAVIGVVGGVLIAMAFGVDSDVSETLGILGGSAVGLGFLGCLL